MTDGTGAFNGTAVWIGQVPPPPSQIDQAREAYGRLVVPAATVAFNPTRRTLVNFDTWFWRTGLTAGELRGMSALV
jgi:hypothetical protein